jgi:uracil-DNA glycosylase
VTPEIRDELLVLVRSAKAYLELEQEHGSAGLALSLAPATSAQAITATHARPAATGSSGSSAPVNAGSAAAARAAAIATGGPPARPAISQVPAPAARSEIAAAALSKARPAVAGLSPALGLHEGAASSGPVADAQPPTAAAIPLALREQRLMLLAQQASSCRACGLHEARRQAVFARGSALAELAFVGEGPGRDEDVQGLPFVGAAGQLLDKMVAAMGYARDDVYVCNVVKCRPPENRTPRPEEALACSQYLVPQLETVAPKMIVALGRCAAQALGVADATGSWRGRFGAWRGIPVMPTYHPAYLLRSPEFKRTVWEDLQQVMGRLGRVRPKA